MRKWFNDKVAIVTGGGAGIGRALALELGGRGASVVVTDLREERVEEVKAELEGMGVRAVGFVVDHSKESSVKEFAEAFFKEWEQVDILCLNAGVGHGGNIESIPTSDWEWVFSINIWGAIYMIQQFTPGMVERRSGSILITASGAGLIGLPGMGPYCASKFAMVGLGESMRLEMKAHNVKVSVLCPGIINTNVVCDGKVGDGDAGHSLKSKVGDFYKKFGTDPSVVARDAALAIKHDIGIMPSPSHMWPPWLLKRVSPAAYQAIGRLAWGKGVRA